MIKNLIFDVGDVLIEYRWREMLYDHGVTGRLRNASDRSCLRQGSGESWMPEKFLWRRP